MKLSKKLFGRVPSNVDTGNTSAPLSGIDLLVNTPGLWRMNEQQRAAMTVSCRDTDYIPKVKNAGSLVKYKGDEVQVMHNGLKMVAGGYHGDWMAGIIEQLHGHHEPQEEKAFYEVLQKLDSGATMIELGSFWSYYSAWFQKSIDNAQNICCEPDPTNLDIGKRNMEINGFLESVQFFEAAAGDEHDAKTTVVMDSDPPKTREVPIYTVDGIMAKAGWARLDLLHMDVQGFEMPALKGSINAIKEGRVRFVFVSTHHYFFSQNPNTHAECLEFLRSNGAHIISSHTIAESFSGDGLIVASFDERDKDFKIDMQLNHTDQSLFRPYEEDLAILIAASQQ